MLYVKKQGERHPKDEVEKKVMLVFVMLVGLGQSGKTFLNKTAIEADGTGVAYENNAYRQMQKLEEDYKAERISGREYAERKKQVEAGSIIS